MNFVKSAIKIEEKSAAIDGLNINYKRIGDGNIPIILLHGWGISSDKYVETAKQLCVQGSECSFFAPDLPGFGKSDNPQEAWGVENYVEIIKKLSDILKLEKLILIGHSFGGRIGIKFAAKYPEKLRALVLTGAAGIKHNPTLKQKIFFVLAKAGKIIFSLPLINKLEESAKKFLYKAAREKDYYKAQGVMKETLKKVIDEDLTGCLGKITTPTLLIWGRNDHSTPFKDGELMHFEIRNSKFEILDDSDHRAPYQYPEKFARIIIGFFDLNR